MNAQAELVENRVKAAVPKHVTIPSVINDNDIHSTDSITTTTSTNINNKGKSKISKPLIKTYDVDAKVTSATAIAKGGQSKVVTLDGNNYSIKKLSASVDDNLLLKHNINSHTSNSSINNREFAIRNSTACYRSD